MMNESKDKKADSKKEPAKKKNKKKSIEEPAGDEKKRETSKSSAQASDGSSTKSDPKKRPTAKKPLKPRPKKLPEKRRHPFFRTFVRITSLVGIVVVIVLFLGLPNLVSYQPRFCGQCHDEDKKPVYTRWRTSTHAKIGCMECHVRGDLKNTLLSRLGLAQQIWMWMVPEEQREKPIGFDSPPTNETCIPCHEARKRISPSGDIIIPHQSHIKIRKLDCVDCHSGFVCRRTAKGKAIVSMEGCYRCHNGRRATNECTACHTEKGVPPSHRDRWVLEHGEDALADKGPCMDCHSKPKDFCNTCHGVKPPSHVADFGVTHSLQAKQNKAACLECHDEKGVCAKCHGESGTQHAIDWTSIHPNIASSGIRDCFECHSKIHCNQCHREPH